MAIKTKTAAHSMLYSFISCNKQGNVESANAKPSEEFQFPGRVHSSWRCASPGPDLARKKIVLTVMYSGSIRAAGGTRTKALAASTLRPSLWTKQRPNTPGIVSTLPDTATTAPVDRVFSSSARSSMLVVQRFHRMSVDCR